MNRSSCGDEVAAALDTAGLEWCHLRGKPEGGSDVDLLVETGRAAEVDAALDAAGFIKLRSWGRQWFYLTAVTDDRGRPRDWMAVHITDELAFGDRYELVLGGAESCLQRCGPSPAGLPTIAAQDEFWVVLLHALLDKGAIAPKHRDRLAELASIATPTEELAQRLARLVGAAWPAQLHALAAVRRWPELEALARPLRAAWRRRGVVIARRLRNSSALAARKLAEPLTRPAPSVALLGPDGAGKSTLAARLCEAYFFGGRVVYLGLHSAREPVVDVPIPGAAFLHRLGRVLLRSTAARYHMARRRLVVLDRHPYDALTTTGSTGRTRLTGRLLVAAALSPDVVFVLDAPAALLHERSAEHTVADLDRMRASYSALAARLPNAYVVDATASADSVAAETMALLWQTIRRRAGKRRR